jgi:hypothetical protein
LCAHEIVVELEKRFVDAVQRVHSEAFEQPSEVLAEHVFVQVAELEAQQISRNGRCEVLHFFSRTRLAWRKAGRNQLFEILGGPTGDLIPGGVQAQQLSKRREFGGG